VRSAGYPADDNSHRQPFHAGWNRIDFADWWAPAATPLAIEANATDAR